MCLFRGLLFFIIFLVFILPVILFMSLGRSFVSWRNRDKKPRNPSCSTEGEQTAYQDNMADEPIDPAKIEYIDFEEVKNDDKS